MESCCSNSSKRGVYGGHYTLGHLINPVQSDVSPALIMKKVEAASGAKYSAHKEAPRKFEPITPVGSSYTPIGRLDIAALKIAPTPASKPALPPPSRPTVGRPPVSAGSLY